MTALGLDAFNALRSEQAQEALLACCSSPRWADAVAGARPYAAPADLCATADRALAALGEADVDDALAGHPRIGQPTQGPDGEWSRREQSAAGGADQRIAAALADGNRHYEAQFGHVYLVCATGKSAAELLALLQARMGNDPGTERQVVRAELAAINRIRIARMIAGDVG